MSRKLFAFLLSELQVMRLVCQREDCGGVMEFRIDRADDRLKRPSCPLCKTTLVQEDVGYTNALGRLVDEIRKLAVLTPTVQIEFVLPDTSG